ncbi:MAG TPA: hypothetical protein VII95_14210 [Terriglobales bacterium]|jgi:hypothetical protein
MLVLLDNGTPRGVAQSLEGHTVKECREQDWDELSNGELLTAAEVAGFEVPVTTDKNIRYQQNLAGRRIAIVVLGKGRWRLIRPMLANVSAAVNAATPGSYAEVDIPG